jgi:hypothetical protein
MEAIVERSDIDREAAALQALARRLTAASSVIGSPVNSRGSAPAQIAASALTALVDKLFDDRDLPLAWLAASAFAAAYPDQGELESLRRGIELSRNPSDVAEALLRCATEVTGRAGNPLADVEVRRNAILLDVETSGSPRTDPETRLLRSGLFPALAELGCVEVGWSRWSSGLQVQPSHERDRDASTPACFVIPWRSVIVAVGAPNVATCSPFAALAAHSGNALVLVGPDLAALANADMIPAEDVERGVEFTTVIKHAHTVVALSHTVEEQFGGLAQMLVSQGLSGPAVAVTALPGLEIASSAGKQAGAEPGDGSVMVFGHPGDGGGIDVVLAATHRLWDAGETFVLRVPAAEWQPADREKLRTDAGRHAERLVIHDDLAPDDLTAMDALPRCCVCVPSADSALASLSNALQAGLPVLASNVGSLSQATGAARHVDPRNESDVAVGLQTLLKEEGSWSGPPTRTWSDWAGEVLDVVRRVQTDMR